MRISTVTFTKTVNLGNYENFKIAADVEILPGENAAEAMAKLTGFVDAQAAKYARDVSAARARG
jgi:hypothetical protein